MSKRNNRSLAKVTEKATKVMNSPYSPALAKSMAASVLANAAGKKIKSK